MSRTTLCVVTAASLTVVSLVVVAMRYHALGAEVRLPGGSGAWKITLTVQGTAVGDARVITTAPLDLGRQHVLREQYSSRQMEHKAPETASDKRRQVYWSKAPGQKDGSFRLRCEYQVALDVRHPTASMARLARTQYSAPQAGQDLELESRGSDHDFLSDQARALTAGFTSPGDEAEALYRFVTHEVANDPDLHVASAADSNRSLEAVAAACLRDGSGTSADKSRLLAVLLRHRGIAARLVTGVALARGEAHHPHEWVEAWVRDHWLPMCPFHGHYGKVPPTYLVFGFGEKPLVRVKHVKDLAHAFLVEKVGAAEQEAGVSPLKRFFRSVSLTRLPPAEQQLAEFLLLLPVAALIICIYRNVIGLHSFGTFAPALVGLAFRDLHSLPGVLVFVVILLVGWLLRRVLDRFHLLQVPRISLMMSLIVLVLLLIIVAATHWDLPVTRYVSLFPLIILTGMVERFWTMEAEDGAAASFRTLFNTLLIAGTISVLLGLSGLVSLLFSFPELLGVLLAGQLLIGRYTGFRLMELYRFRDFLRTPQPALHPG